MLMLTQPRIHVHSVFVLSQDEITTKSEIFDVVVYNFNLASTVRGFKAHATVFIGCIKGNFQLTDTSSPAYFFVSTSAVNYYCL